MSSLAVLGAMWGDEAKAKMVDYYAEEADIVVRFQGGNNAGHTIYANNQKFIFHLIPSGIMYPEKICMLGAGVVIDPESLITEMKKLQGTGISFENRFFIDPRANVVLPIHKELDALQEKQADRQKIGTTKRGIGPCYADAIARKGIKLYDLIQENTLTDKVSKLYDLHEKMAPKELITELLKQGSFFKKYFMQVSYYLERAYKDGKKIIFEGAQGALLDVFFGSYPFVTSSHTIAGGISVGCGLSVQKIDRIIGVYKSYFTRVGTGPFPTELFDTTGDQIRKQGNEFGSTTGRPRRCGWFDCVAAKYTAMINGINEISLTLLDVLGGIETLKIGVSYSLNNTEISEFPYSPETLEEIQVNYITLNGWQEDISSVTKYEDLPEAAKNYVETLEKQIGLPVTTISVGPKRNQTIIR